ncbi:Amino acid transporter AVT6C [Glycine soja]|uniref:Amino acid transporter AVT6C n=1 Tax=Glycine soja TaxID=3848 RepID=A0A445F2H1_GLYSO|nr:Amino acid transporter AVT6C [Glycine soja]
MEETLGAMKEVFGKKVFVLSLGNRKDDSSLTLTGDLPHLEEWKKLLPGPFKCYANMWTLYSQLVVIVLVALITDVTVEFMLRYTSSGKSSTYVGMMVESFGSIGSLAIKICVIITNLGVLIIYFIILGDVLCGNESNDIAHLGILQDWFGINWLTSRAFALLFVALFIMVPLVMLRRVALVFVVICSSMAISALLSGKSQTPRIVPDFSQVTVIYLFTTIPVFVMGSDSMPMSFYSLVIDYQIVVIDYQ